MVHSSGPRIAVSLRSGPPVLQWGLMVAVSVGLAVALEAFHLPAALLLGPMLGAIVVAAAAGTIQVPKTLFYLGQAVVGCLIARSLPISAMGPAVENWPLFTAGVLSVVVASSTLGWLLTRWQVLPGVTAIWGSAPGAATAMTLMAESFGADIRLVAFMQYTRVACVAMTASLVASLWIAEGGGGGALPTMDWFPVVHGPALAATIAISVGSALIAPRLRIPAGPMLMSMVLSAAMQASGLAHIELPPLLLAPAYAVVGWTIGLRFTLQILAYAARALPMILGSIVALIAVCGLFAAGLVVMAGVDPLTAYLATSPGGMDSVAIIAASTKVDVPFVMAMQMLRFIVVLFTGPALARFLSGRVTAKSMAE